MAHYPDYFYFQRDIVDQTYSSNPSGGELDVHRLVSGHSTCFYQSDVKSRVTPKKLIWNDWRSLFWDEIESGKAKKALCQLLEDGFEIYYMQSGSLQTLDPKNLDELFQSQKERPGLPFDNDTLKKTAAEAGIPADEVLVLNDHRFECLLQDDYTLEHTIIIYDYKNMTPECLTAILKASPDLKTLNLRHYGIEKTLDLTHIQLHQLERLDLAAARIHAANLNALLEAAPNLKGLDLRESNITTGALEIIQNQLYQLEWLFLEGSNINTKNLTALLEAAPNLKKLEFRFYDINGALDLTHIQLHQLEILDLASAKIDAANLNALLQAAPNLKKLHLMCSRITGTLEINQNQLHQLEILDLGGSNINTDNLTTLLQAAPHLKKLDLRCIQITGTLELTQNQLHQLEPLNLAFSKITVDNLTTLLQAAPNLEIINLNACTITGQVAAELIQRLPVNHSIHIIGLDSINISTLRQAQPNKVPAPLPEHDHKKYKNYRRPTESSPFAQGAIIRKLTAYLKRKDLSDPMIEHIQVGICNPLAWFFKREGAETIKALIDQSNRWDGRANPDERLTQLFEQLIGYIQTLQFNPGKRRFIGQEGLDDFLKNIPLNTSHILVNPWHAIAVRRLAGNQWQLYDPNHRDGPLTGLYDAHVKAGVVRFLGPLLMCLPDSPAQSDRHISDKNAFLEQGGLLVLYKCCDDDIKPLLKALESHPFSKQALEGILLRAISEEPAWLIAQQSGHPGLQRFTKTLLTQFATAFPNDYQTKLHRSIPEQLRQATSSPAITEPVVSSPDLPISGSSHTTDQQPASPSDSLAAAIQIMDKALPYRQALTTWDTRETASEHPTLYAQRLMAKHTDKKNRLVKVSGQPALDGLMQSLVGYCEHTQRPFFYVDAPEDLITSAPFIQQAGERCVRQQGPGGPLYDFLKQDFQADKSPVLIVNYAQFKQADLVRFNSLLDAQPKADGTPLPEQTLVIGLMDTETPDCYQGSDFYSRFDIIDSSPFTGEAFEPLPAIELVTDSSEEAFSIHLYDNPRWENALLGRWKLQFGKQGYEFKFEEGPLLKAIERHQPIHIQNGPWHDEAFQRFWTLVRTSGYRYAGRLIQMPKETVLTHSEGYGITPPMRLQNSDASENARLLNPSAFFQYFSHYALDDRGHLNETPGLLEQHAAQHPEAPLILRITRNLSKGQWARLFEEARYHQVKLQMIPITLEDPWQTSAAPLPEPLPWNGVSQEAVMLVDSTDPDTTIAELQAQGEWLVIDVTETDASELLTRLTVTDTDDGWHFTQDNGALLTALQENRQVILRGIFHPRLVDQLAPMILERMKHADQATGRLVMLPDEINDFAFAGQPYQHTVSNKDKLKHFSPEHQPIIQPLMENDEPLSRLQARLHDVLQHPDGNSDHAWSVMQRLPDNLKQLSHTLDTAVSRKQAKDFHQNRFNQVQNVLSHNPYVFLAGLTGVGKTTFVQKVLCGEDTHHQLYNGEQAIKAWAESTPNEQGFNILFIDEATLSQRDWTEFESLFSEPPTLLIHGRLHKLSSSHKVVFAGNPVSYGDERQLASLFKRHGLAEVFEPLSVDVIYEDILKPVFNNTGLVSENIEALCRPILHVYAFLCACSSTQVLISPRELQMIALLTLSQTTQNPDIDAQDTLKQALYHICEPLVPSARKQQFEQQFKPDRVSSTSSTHPHNTDFFITPSRQSVVNQMNQLLALRHFRQASNRNEVQQYGGLGGLILEGEPGIGKSDLVIHQLTANGYEERRFNDQSNPAHQAIFYRIPASMSIENKQACLLKAFNEGAIVIMDEINTSPMMEALLNHLLMGQHPDGTRPERPGFIIIGTQNPITMTGRKAPSTALKRRMTTTVLHQYPDDEIQQILTHRGLSPEASTQLIRTFHERLNFARQHHKQPEPSFRDLLKTADDAIKAEQAQAQEIKQSLPGPKQTESDLKEALERLSQTCSNSTGIQQMLQLFIKPLDEQEVINQMKNIAQERLNGKKHPWANRTSFFKFQHGFPGRLHETKQFYDFLNNNSTLDKDAIVAQINRILSPTISSQNKVDAP